MALLKGALAFYSKNCSSRSKRTVLTEVRNPVYGRSYGSSAPCEAPQLPRTRRRLSKDERRAMVESFVNKYRATNEGKFPGLKAVCKEIGGDFYVVRTIFQELKFNSEACFPRSRNEKLIQDAKPLSEADVISTAVAGVQNAASTPDMNNETYNEQAEPDRGFEIAAHFKRGASNEVVEPKSQAGNSDLAETQTNLLSGVEINVSQSSPGKAEGISNNGNSDNIKIHKRRTKTVSAEFKIPDLDEKQSTSENIKTCNGQELNKDKTDRMSRVGSAKSNQRKHQAVTENLMHSDDRKPNIDQNSGSLDLGNDETKTKGYKKKAIAAGVSSDAEYPENKTEQSQGSIEVEKDARENLERQANDAKAEKKPNLWGNIKSFADGIINIWRKW